MINNLPKLGLSETSRRPRVPPLWGHGANLQVNLNLNETEFNTILLTPGVIHIRKRHLELPFPIQSPPKRCRRLLQTPPKMAPSIYPSLLGITADVNQKPISIASERHVLKRASLVAFGNLHAWGSNQPGEGRIYTEGISGTPDIRTWEEAIHRLQQRRPGLVSSALVLSRSAAFVPLSFPGPAFQWGPNKDEVSKRNG